MPEITHTPGPWYTVGAANIHDQGIVASETTGETVAVTYQGSADAHFIAAAPTMLATLKRLVSDPDLDAAEAVRIIEAAIAQAEGR